jgi:hypothetical protein
MEQGYGMCLCFSALVMGIPAGAVVVAAGLQLETEKDLQVIGWRQPLGWFLPDDKNL